MFFFNIFVIILLNTNIYANTTFFIVISKESKINKLTRNDISKLFLSKMKSFPNGEKSLPIEINNKELQTKFYRKITNKNEKQLLKYWVKMIFTGKGTPPKRFGTLKELLDFLKKNKNAITYLNTRPLSHDLKILMEIN